MSNFDTPTEFGLSQLTIDGNDVRGLFVSLSVFENIYTPLVTGHVSLIETDEAKFIEKYKIEGVEKFQCEFKTGKDSYSFEGYLNGLRNKSNSQQITTYTFDFTTEEVRKNEETFITKAFKEKNPKDIVTEMIEKMGGKQDKVDGSGKPMTLLPSNKRPYDVIKYVLTHGVPDDNNASEGEKETVQETAKGNGGFMCWNTADGFRFNTIKKVMDGSAGGDGGEFKSQMMNKGQSIGEMMKSIVAYDFQIMGDFQSKLRSGAFVSKHISFDLDKLHYKEYEYDNTEECSQKQKEALKGAKKTRIFCTPHSNERHQNECQKAQNSKYDQRRYWVQQTPGGENTHDDIQGTVTLYPACKIRAGDTITLKIARVESGQYDKKHSGKYVCSEVAHHFNNADGRAYTRVSVIRSTKQQDDSSS
jgi:hypothetical protein